MNPIKWNKNTKKFEGEFLYIDEPREMSLQEAVDAAKVILRDKGARERRDSALADAQAIYDWENR